MVSFWMNITYLLLCNNKLASRNRDLLIVVQGIILEMLYIEHLLKRMEEATDKRKNSVRFKIHVILWVLEYFFVL